MNQVRFHDGSHKSHAAPRRAPGAQVARLGRFGGRFIERPDEPGQLALLLPEHQDHFGRGRRGFFRDRFGFVRGREIYRQNHEPHGGEGGPGAGVGPQ